MSVKQRLTANLARAYLNGTVESVLVDILGDEVDLNDHTSSLGDKLFYSISEEDLCDHLDIEDIDDAIVSLQSRLVEEAQLNYFGPKTDISEDLFSVELNEDEGLVEIHCEVP